MGIGNALAAVRHQAQQRLITPHGDRKHARLVGHRARQTPGLRSLPLMGIGNPAHRSARQLRRRRHTHYPSWGSETLPCPEHPNREAYISLPLMGIGNKDVTDAILSPVYAASLPLMGIGNGRRPRLPVAGGEGKGSLPLMGIGNAVGDTHDSHGRHSTSLLLMGIGNSRCRRARHRVL